MQKNQIKECALVLYKELNEERKVNPDIIMQKTGLDFETSYEICLVIWRAMRDDASRMAQDVLMTGI